ncbi:MAG: hypothetical protein HGB12_08235 [Bacteroidetes bacterium]|nr:hypothetical protein [Bacteroidota bacterium]
MKANKILKNIVYALLTYLPASMAFYFSLLTFNSFAQGVAINATGTAADNSAMLDIDATGMSPKAGLLIPRMNTTERNFIVSPATGLQIYNTSTNCLEIYVGTTWQIVVCGCTSTPVAAGSISGTATVCPGQNAVLYSVPAITRATSYIWSYSGTGAFIVGSTNAVIVYFSGTATSGNLTVQGTNACGNGTVSADYPIAVNSTAPNITAQPASVATCLGSGAVTFTVTASGGLSYQWQEYIGSWNNVANAGVYSNVTTSILTITNPPAGMDGNKYRCIVNGTCTSSTSDGAATLTVISLPSVTNASTATICSGTSPNITLTSSVPSNFAWTIGTITGSITGANGSSGATINQTLTNPSNATAGSVQYLVTPTSTTGSCVGTAFAITITVNPTPTITNTPLTQSICSGVNTTLVTLTSDVSGTTFAWTASASAGISGFTSSGTSTIPVQTISNSGSTAGTVTYAITPTANSCTGTISNYVTTINPFATGGTITYTDASGLNPRTSPQYSGGYTIHTFTSSGTFTPNCSGNVNILVVAGGGGGGAQGEGGGGGAGGLIYNSSYSVTGGNGITVTVGGGGNGSDNDAIKGYNGANSVFGSLTAIGGGGGGSNSTRPGADGGSGGGGSFASSAPGGAGTSGQGNAGGASCVSAADEAGGGGGGAGAVGGTAIGSPTLGATVPGAGGAGLQYSISGTPTYYSGGGGGGTMRTSPGGLAGNGGGGAGRGNSIGPFNGTPNTGGGGGGGGNNVNAPGANGGSGIVIIRYPN